MSAAKEDTGHKKHAGRGSHSGSHGGGHEEAHEGAPEWLISFADNVTLMMGFFVIMFAMNIQQAVTGGGSSDQPGGGQANPATMDLIVAIREAFNNPVDLNSTDPADLPLIQHLLARSLSASQREGQLGYEHDVRSIRPSQYFGTAGVVSFDAGSSQLNEGAPDAIQQILKPLKGYRFIVDIRGHVDAVEAHASNDRGMRMSYERAQAVATYMVTEGVPWEQLRLIACGDGDRILPVTYESEEHLINRRVEIVVTDEVLRDENSTR